MKSNIPIEIFTWLRIFMGSEPEPEAGPDTVLGYGKKHPLLTYSAIEKTDPGYLEWTLQHVHHGSSPAMRSFARWIGNRYRLRDKKLEMISPMNPSVSAPPKKLEQTPEQTYEDQLDSTLMSLLDSEPEQINALAERLVKADPNYQLVGRPSARTVIGVQSLEIMYRSMMAFDETESAEDDER